MRKSPIDIVKEKGGKEKVIAAVKALATDALFLNSDKAPAVLERTSNAKLIRLERILSEVKKTFGSRSALIDAIMKLEKREKDAGYKTHLEGKSTPDLLDRYRAIEKQERAKKYKAQSTKN